MKFSEKVRILRTKNGLSQEELAEKLDVSRQTISKWEAGVSFPEIEKLISLSDIFQVSIDYLLKDKQISTNSSENLDRIVFRFFNSSYEMADISHQLVEIMEDGIIDDSEKIQMESIICKIDKISENIEKIKRAINLTNNVENDDFQ